MSYQDIERWKTMSKDKLYQELVSLYKDMPPIDNITHIYVNNCYELGAEVGGYANNFFVSLYPESVESDLNFSNVYLGDVYHRNPYKISLAGDR